MAELVRADLGAVQWFDAARTPSCPRRIRWPDHLRFLRKDQPARECPRTEDRLRSPRARSSKSSFVRCRSCRCGTRRTRSRTRRRRAPRRRNITSRRAAAARTATRAPPLPVPRVADAGRREAPLESEPSEEDQVQRHVIEQPFVATVGQLGRGVHQVARRGQVAERHAGRPRAQRLEDV